jgi:hypothetical protein
MTSGIIKFLLLGLVMGPLGVILGGGSIELALTIAIGFIVWIVVAYVVTKPIELVVNNKDKISNFITKKNNTFTSVEEEKIYERVSKEFSENKKEGLWTKALIQSEGDENKAKYIYMKLRAEQLTKELKIKSKN